MELEHMNSYWHTASGGCKFNGLVKAPNEWSHPLKHVLRFKKLGFLEPTHAHIYYKYHNTVYRYTAHFSRDLSGSPLRSVASSFGPRSRCALSLWMLTVARWVCPWSSPSEDSKGISWPPYWTIGPGTLVWYTSPSKLMNGHQDLSYPLVNVYITMENHHFIGKTHYKWPFSIAMLNYQRVIGPEIGVLAHCWISGQALHCHCCSKWRGYIITWTFLADGGPKSLSSSCSYVCIHS